jgi:hypothetical protein
MDNLRKNSMFLSSGFQNSQQFIISYFQTFICTKKNIMTSELSLHCFLLLLAHLTLVSYCHHLASVVVVRQKFSPLKVLDQWKPNLVWIITRVSSFKNCVRWCRAPTNMPLLLKIEHMVKLDLDMPHIFAI